MRAVLLDTLYASASETPAWASFAQSVRDAFGCDQAAIAIDSGDGTGAIVTGADEGHMAAIEAMLAGLAAPVSCDGGLVVREVAEGHALILTVAGPAPSGARIVLWRQASAAGFDAGVSDLLASLADPLRRSLRIYYRFVDLVRRASLSELALETSRIGAALVAMEGDVILANRVAGEIFEKGDGLRVFRGRLHAETPDDTRMLLDEVRRCALGQAAEVDPSQYTPLPFGRRDHDLPLTVIVRPGPGFHPLARPLRRTAILVIRDPEQQASWPAAAVARLFGLSTAEALVASELARGASLDEAASALGVSRNTVRSQLRAIFLKTGINRQSDLIRALLNSAATST